MDLREIERGGMMWIDLDRFRIQWRSLVSRVMKILVP
jgi:hypothetical protein